MSAELLRRAASLMRERAEAATPGPWTQHTAEAAADTVIFAGREWVTNIDNCPKVGEHMRTPGGSICSDQALPNGVHIASWHPAVALAVAKAMDDVADAWEINDGWALDPDDDPIRFEDTLDGGWVSVARAYLGSEA